MDVVGWVVGGLVVGLDVVSLGDKGFFDRMVMPSGFKWYKHQNGMMVMPSGKMVMLFGTIGFAFDFGR